MRCIICDSTDKWENIDQYRTKPSGMSICKGCGFVSYPAQWKSEAEIKEYYREAYRQPPAMGNIFTGQRKLNFHRAFLTPLFKEWQEKGLDKPVVGEIGAAFGMFLDWVRKCVPGAEVYGTEWTTSYRRVAYHDYGIELTEDFDPSRKYDLIVSYKVAEHQMDADILMRQYVEALKPNGYFYVSVPTWFGEMSNFGVPGFNIEYYYHTNHINVWSRKLFQTFLKKVGLKVVRSNFVYYNDTYLCVRDDSLMSEPREYENPEEIMALMERIKGAFQAAESGDFMKALELYPNFPQAHTGRYEIKRAEWHKEGFDLIKQQIIEPALKQCPESTDVRVLSGDLCMRYDRYDLALQYFEQALKMKPDDAFSLMQIGQCFRHLSEREKDPKASMRFRAQAHDVMKYLTTVSKQVEPEAVSWMLLDSANIPMPSEL